jgi:hypothetical protein
MSKNVIYTFSPLSPTHAAKCRRSVGSRLFCCASSTLIKSTPHTGSPIRPKYSESHCDSIDPDCRSCIRPRCQGSRVRFYSQCNSRVVDRWYKICCERGVGCSKSTRHCCILERGKCRRAPQNRWLRCSTRRSKRVDQRCGSVHTREEQNARE